MRAIWAIASSSFKLKSTPSWLGIVTITLSAAATAKLEVRQLWSAAAMCLVLLPVAVVVAGLWMGIAGLIMGVQWALDVDGSVWLGIGRWLVVGADLAGAGYGLFASVRWVAGLVETWKGRGMPKLPRWRKR